MGRNSKWEGRGRKPEWAYKTLGYVGVGKEPLWRGNNGGVSGGEGEVKGKRGGMIKVQELARVVLGNWCEKRSHVEV